MLHSWVRRAVTAERRADAAEQRIKQLEELITTINQEEKLKRFLGY